jgi:arsenical pump membrane protein
VPPGRVVWHGHGVSAGGTETSGASTGGAAARVGPLQWALASLGGIVLVFACLLAPTHARAAAAQDWPPFVLVSGLLLVGLVAAEDGVFTAAGHALARVSRHGWVLYAGSTVLVLVVTTLLNLDTSVTFVTPVLIYAARSRGEEEAPLMYGCLLLANAGSLLLPGSNLTNLIVLGHLHLSGTEYLAHIAAAALAAAAVTAVVVALAHRRALRTAAAPSPERVRPVVGVGLAAVAAVTVIVVALHAAVAAIAVALIGVGAVALRRRAGAPGAALGVLELPVLAGLFGLAVALGTLGRSWTGPATLLSHLDAWGTAAFAAAASIVVNNLPAASLLAARRPPHPFALLIGLNVGPNLFATGSLAWVLWLRAARSAGGRPDLRRASLLGLASAPLAIAAALLALGGSG